MTELEEIPKGALRFVKSPVDKLEEVALTKGIEELIPEHIFSNGIYVRAVLMTAAKPLVIGHRHNTRHLNVVMTGKALVSQDGKVNLIEAPCVFESKEAVRKSLYIIEDMIWLTVHPNEKEEYSQEMEDHFITKTENYKEYAKEREMLLEAVEKEEEKWLGDS